MHATANHLHAERVQRHQPIERMLFISLSTLVFPKEVHNCLCRTQRRLPVVVVSPKDRFIPLEPDEFPVAQRGETIDDLVSLEPGAVKQ